MSVTIKLKYLRHSSRKLAYVTKSFTKMNLDKALQLTSVMSQHSASFLHKALKMAEDSARQKELDPEKMIITKLITNVGPKIKRMRPTARGHASRFQKHLAHLVVTIDEKKEKIAKKEKKNGSKD